MPGARPRRRSDGRPGPPKGYPQDPELYADPANWKYPVHTPIHARRARQYFNKPANRAKYTASEREFMDARINEALQRFGVAAEMGLPQEKMAALALERAAGMSREGLLIHAAGRSRMARARDETPSARFEDKGPRRWSGTVGPYGFSVDSGRRRVAHDCPDFRRQAQRGALCKHICRAFLDMPEAQAVEALRSLVVEDWEFAVE